MRLRFGETLKLFRKRPACQKFATNVAAPKTPPLLHFTPSVMLLLLAKTQKPFATARPNVGSRRIPHKLF